MASLTSIACELKEEFANKQTEIPCIIVGCTYIHSTVKQFCSFGKIPNRTKKMPGKLIAIDKVIIVD